MKSFGIPTIVLTTLALCAGCVDSSTPPQTPEASAFARDYANMVVFQYLKAVESAEFLDRSITDFVESPSETGLNAARDAWRAARITYGPTEAFRYYNGPIDDEDGPEGLINAWPMDEAWLDYVEGVADAGIIQQTNLYSEITRDLLVSLNEKEGETNISTGYHAIEFLLWGQDLDPNGAGQRPVSDYTTHPNAARRGQALRILSALLVEQLQGLRNEWTPEIGAYRENFAALSTKEAMKKAFTGILMLSGDEMAQERIYVAYESGDQEDEHSCFSDNTRADLLSNQQGVRSVATLLTKAIDAPEAAKLLDALDASDTALNALPDPFDKALNSNDPAIRAPLLKAVEALEAQTEAILALANTQTIELDAP